MPFLHSDKPMNKSLLALACLLCWLNITAQITSKKVFSFGAIPSVDKPGLTSDDDELIPFKLVGGLTFVNGAHNGVASTYILDTGAPGLILNNKLDKTQLDDLYIASGLTGNTSIGEYIVDEFKILNITKQEFLAHQMDLEHIEDEILHRFSGLVGGDIFDQSILVLDYENQLWGIVKEIPKKEIDKSIPFTLEEHFIVVEIKIGKQNLRMILDTGAEISILDGLSASYLRERSLKDSGITSIQSASSDNTETKNVSVQKFIMDKHVERNHEFSILDFNFINEGLSEKLDGLIGFPFLEGKKVAIDFPSRQIHIYK